MHRHWASLLAVFAAVTWSVAPAMIDLVGCGVVCGVASISPASPAHSVSLPAARPEDGCGDRPCCSTGVEPAGDPVTPRHTPDEPCRCCLFFGCPITSALDQSMQRAPDDEPLTHQAPPTPASLVDASARLETSAASWRPPPPPPRCSAAPPVRTVVLLI